MGLNKYRITDKHWDYFQDIHFFFESFYYYADEINKFIENEVNQARTRLKQFEDTAEDNPFLDAEWFEHSFNMQAKEGLVDIYYDSLISVMYSFIEKKMYYLCSFLSKQHVIELDEIHGKGIFKFRKYLTEVCGINFSQIEKEWQLLAGYNKLRNHIVHSEGIRSISLDNKELINFLGKLDGVRLVKETDTINFHFSNNSVLKLLASTAKKILDHIYIEKG